MKRVTLSAFIAVVLADTALAQADLVGHELPASPGNASIVAVESTPELYDLGGLAASATKYAGAKLGDAPYTGRGRHDSEIYRSLSPSVVIVVTDTGLGSGSYIGLGNSVLTNWHVVKGSQKVGLLFKPSAEGRKPSEADVEIAEVIKVDPGHDLALLRLAAIPATSNPLFWARRETSKSAPTCMRSDTRRGRPGPTPRASSASTGKIMNGARTTVRTRQV